jgi:hypothetical protein
MKHVCFTSPDISHQSTLGPNMLVLGLWVEKKSSWKGARTTIAGIRLTDQRAKCSEKNAKMDMAFKSSRAVHLQ